MMKADSSCEDCEDGPPLVTIYGRCFDAGMSHKNGDITALLHHDISKGCIHDEITLMCTDKRDKISNKIAGILQQNNALILNCRGFNIVHSEKICH